MALPACWLDVRNSVPKKKFETGKIMCRFGGLKESEAVVELGAENLSCRLVGDPLKPEVRIWRIRNIISPRTEIEFLC